MGKDFRPTPREKTVLDNPKLKLTADKLPNGESRPSFSLYWIGNNPRIDVWTGVPNEKDNGRIRATLDDVWVRVFLNKIVELCNPSAPNDSAFIIECKNHTWQNNKRSQEPVVESRIVAGRDKDGRVYVSVLSADPQRSKVRFLFGNTYYNTLSFKNQKLTDAEISWAVAQAWVNNVTTYYGIVAAQNYAHKTADGSKGGNNTGNNQSYRNNGGGNNTAPQTDEYADDLPF